MTQEKIDAFMLANTKYFPPESILMLRTKLSKVVDEKLWVLQSADFKDPTTTLIISLLLGSLGIDRFMIGDTGMGVLKLLTCGLCGILTIVDWFIISKKTKEQNLQKIMAIL